MLLCIKFLRYALMPSKHIMSCNEAQYQDKTLEAQYQDKTL